MYINKFVKFPNLSFFLTFGTLASLFTNALFFKRINKNSGYHFHNRINYDALESAS